jgi:type IV secretory pathway TrbD component
MADMDEGAVRPERGVVGELARDVRELFRLEVELVKTELKGEVRRAGTAATLMGSALVVGVLGVAMLPVALAYALGLTMELWLAFLIVGMGFLLISGVLAYVGARKVANIDPVPHRAVRSIQELGDEVAQRRIDATV